MNKQRANRLITSLSDRWARVGLTALCSLVVAIGSQAQTMDEGTHQMPRALNSELRTNTWSIFTQGGLSWATDVWYPSLHAKRSYKQSPAVGGGIDFTIRPWIRVGAEYIWSRYRREQRMTSLSARTMPIKVYGNYLMNFHNAKLGLGLNFMELWPRRGAQWLNIWLGTGVGYTMAQGNEYTFLLNNTLTQGGKTIPLYDGTSISNEGTLTFSGRVQTKNRHESYQSVYVPASLHIEADVSRQFTIGLKGEMDWILDRKDISPKNLIFGLATLRYNFVHSEAYHLKKYYGEQISVLNDQLNALQQAARDAEARADREAQARAEAERLCADLERRLADCNEAEAGVAQPAHFVQFAHDSYVISRVELERLKEFARSAQGQKIELLAEASTPGATDYNQQLSTRRLKEVVRVLLLEGFAADDLNPQLAIGERNGKPTAEGRRVTLSIKK